MKKLSFVILTIFIFLLAYQIRADFLQTNDYNEPGDSSEFKAASANAATSIRKYLSGDISFDSAYPWLIGALDTHNSPVVNGVNALIELTFHQQRELILLILSSAFPALLFFVARRFFPFSTSIIVSSIALVYTPLYAFIYSYMLESFGSVLVPVLTLAAIFFSLRSSRSIWFSILTGVCLAIIALYRIEFRWVGIPFVVVWFVSYYRKPLIPALVMFFTYFILAVGWMVLARVVGAGSYYQLEGNVMMVLYNTYNYSNDGWMFDTTPLRSFSELLSHIFSQGPFRLVWLQLAQMVRLWARPATMYIGEHPMPDTLLFIFHYLLLIIAIFGLRKAFFTRVFLFLATPLFWATAFSYNPEELRRQVPLVASVILFAGAGLEELKGIYSQRRFRYVLAALFFCGFLIIFDSKVVYGFLSWLYPQALPAFPLRLIVLGVEFVLMIIITKGLLRFDRNRPMLFKHRLASKLPAFIPLTFFVVLILYQSRTYVWHEWSTNLLPFHQIEQSIVVGSNELATIKEQRGYLLIDIRDADSGKNLDVFLNQMLLKDRLSLKETFSTIDLFVLRQFQRGMPRLGFGKIEEEVKSLNVLPNVHQWLIYKVDGELLQEENSIVVRNDSDSYKNTYIYGDYIVDFPPHHIYRGPTAQIFQGGVSFYKYQVDQDIRLVKQSNLNSLRNESSLINDDGELIYDLSNQFGLQRGRYRIFMLFPYRGGDPNSVF